jgi:hypothetical protein
MNGQRASILDTAALPAVCCSASSSVALDLDGSAAVEAGAASRSVSSAGRSRRIRAYCPSARRPVQG